MTFLFSNVLKQMVFLNTYLSHKGLTEHNLLRRFLAKMELQLKLPEAFLVEVSQLVLVQLNV